MNKKQKTKLENLTKRLALLKEEEREYIFLRLSEAGFCLACGRAPEYFMGQLKGCFCENDK